MKVCETCGDEIATKDGDNKCGTCDNKPKPKAKRDRSAMHRAMTSLGLVRVRGALGGVYYE
jgi:hypothetical protein